MSGLAKWRRRESRQYSPRSREVDEMFRTEGVFHGSARFTTRLQAFATSFHFVFDKMGAQPVFYQRERAHIGAIHLPFDKRTVSRATSSDNAQPLAIRASNTEEQTGQRCNPSPCDATLRAHPAQDRPKKRGLKDRNSSFVRTGSTTKVCSQQPFVHGGGPPSDCAAYVFRSSPAWRRSCPPAEHTRAFFEHCSPTATPSCPRRRNSELLRPINIRLIGQLDCQCAFRKQRGAATVSDLRAEARRGDHCSISTVVVRDEYMASNPSHLILVQKDHRFDLT